MIEGSCSRGQGMVRHTYARSFMQSGSCVGENPAAKRLRGEKKTHKVWKSPRAVYQTLIVSTESSIALTCEFTPQAQKHRAPSVSRTRAAYHASQQVPQTR